MGAIPKPKNRADLQKALAVVQRNMETLNHEPGHPKYTTDEEWFIYWHGISCAIKWMLGIKKVLAFPSWMKRDTIFDDDVLDEIDHQDIDISGRGLDRYGKIDS